MVINDNTNKKNALIVKTHLGTIRIYAFWMYIRKSWTVNQETLVKNSNSLKMKSVLFQRLSRVLKAKGNENVMEIKLIKWIIIIKNDNEKKENHGNKKYCYEINDIINFMI